MRRMEERRTAKAEADWDGELLAQRVIGSRLTDGSEVVAKRICEVDVVPSTKEHVLCILVEASQIADQIAYVRADAKVMKLTHVDSDSH